MIEKSMPSVVWGKTTYATIMANATILVNKDGAPKLDDALLVINEKMAGFSASTLLERPYGNGGFTHRYIEGLVAESAAQAAVITGLRGVNADLVIERDRWKALALDYANKIANPVQFLDEPVPAKEAVSPLKLGAVWSGPWR